MSKDEDFSRVLSSIRRIYKLPNWYKEAYPCRYLTIRLDVATMRATMYNVVGEEVSSRELQRLTSDWGDSYSTQAGTPFHPLILEFAQAMQEKLDENSHKSCKWPKDDDNLNGWLEPYCSWQFLLSKLREELEELEYEVDSVTSGLRSHDKLRHEAADVANIAMMLADNLGAFDGHR